LNKGVEDTDRAIDEFSRSIRLSPVDPEIGYALGGLAYALLRKGDYEKAYEDAHRSAREMPRWVGAWFAEAVASVKTDRLQEAQEAIRRVLLLAPHFSISEARRWNMNRDQSKREWFYDSLRKAGLPE
jgi:tetratricopeptide (TPR) repeat protein